MNKFEKTFNLIMESIDTSYSELYNKIKNNEDQEMLNNWVEAIDENNIVPDKEFTIDDMEKFEEILTPEQLDKVIELGVEILHASDENVVTEGDDDALPPPPDDDYQEPPIDPNLDVDDSVPQEGSENDVDECCKDGKCSDGRTVIEDADKTVEQKIDEKVKDFADGVKQGYGWIADDDDDIMTQFINSEDPGVKEDESWYKDYRDVILKKITEVFDEEGIDFVPYSEIDDNGDRIIKDDIISDIANAEAVEKNFHAEANSDIIEEHHVAEDSWFPVRTKDGVDTGWRMGSTDFGGRKRNPMKCSADPSHVVKKYEPIMINPKFRGQQIAIETYYKAKDGDAALAEKLKTEFGLPMDLDI